MNYEEAKDYIKKLNMFGMKLGLERIEKLLLMAGNPERKFRSILVGGTSGKGSTAVMIASVLREAGFRTGLFVKPHLFDFRERISINGENISEADFIRLADRLKPFAEDVEEEIESPTFFEFITALAFEYFAEKKVDIAVVEVGLGGRLDATNVLKPEVSVITNVSLEHTEILGDTVEKISGEKAGIVKENGILVTGSENPKVKGVLERICRERNSRLVHGTGLDNADSTTSGNSFDLEGTRVNVPLAGRFQLSNISCALAAIRSLKDRIPADAIKRGMENIKWPGRFEIVNKEPIVILDGAKDPDSLSKIMESLDMFEYDKLYTVFGVSRDKMIPEIIREASKKTGLFFLTMHKVNGRGLEPEAMTKEVEKNGKDFVIVGDVKEAVRKAKKQAGRNDLVLVTGSLFTAAEARELWFPGKAEMGREFNENLEVN